MRSLDTLSTFLLLATFAASACTGGSDAGSGSADGGSGASGEPVELDAFAEQAARATCARVFDCCTDEEVETHFNEPGFGFNSMEDCVSLYQGLAEALAIPGLRMSMDRGYLEYDAEAVGGCMEDYAAAACGELALVAGDARDDECPGAFVPMQRTGDPCLSDGDCIDGSCNYTEGAEGTCMPLPQAGEPCAFACAEPLRCGSDESFEYHCLPRLSVGEACSSGEDCESLQCIGEPGASTCEDGQVCQGA